MLGASKRVALVTTISPRALVDVLFVALADPPPDPAARDALCAAGPGTLGFLRLTRAAITHLAVTGGIAAGDSLVQQILGHGIAARLSARLGEGVINGLLTARVGIAAIEVCRPLPFVNGKPPRLADVMAELRRIGSEDKTKRRMSAPATDARPNAPPSAPSRPRPDQRPAADTRRCAGGCRPCPRRLRASGRRAGRPG